MTDWPPLRDYGHSFAVIMGTWDYKFLDPVPAAEHSLRRMERLLTGRLCGWPRERMLVLPNVSSPGDVPDQLITAFADISDVALFYFVGHGQITPDDQLCLGLTGSRVEANRRAATGLRFPDVRQALQDSEAATKIVILDCCFAGLATRGTQAGLPGDVMELTAGTGAYTMAATSAYTTAWYQDDLELTEPQTYFTKYLADLVDEGMPEKPAQLKLDTLFRELREKLATDHRPVPQSRNVNDARDFIFAYNAAPPQTYRDPELEVVQLSHSLAESESLREADAAQIRALRAEAAVREKELARLNLLMTRTAVQDGQQKRELQNAIDAEARELDDNRAAQAAVLATSPDPSTIEHVQERSESGPSMAAEIYRRASDRASSARANPEDSLHHSSSLFRAPVTDSYRSKLGRPRIIAIAATAAAAVIAAAIWIPIALSGSGQQPSSGASHPPSGVSTSASGGQPTNQPVGGSLAATLDDPGRIDSVAFASDNKTLAAVDDNSHTYIWDTATQTKTATLPNDHNTSTSSAAFAPHSDILATGDNSGSTFLWNAATGAKTATLTDPSSKGVSSVAFASDGKTLATADANGRIYVWNITSKTITATFIQPNNHGIWAIAFASDGKTIAACDQAGSVYLWSTVTDTQTGTFNVHGRPMAVALTSDGGTVAAGNDNGDTNLWYITNKKYKTFDDPGHLNVNAIAFTPDDKTLVTSDFYGHIYFWNVTSGSRILSLNAPSGSLINSVAFAPNGKTLAASDYDGHVYLWQITGM